MAFLYEKIDALLISADMLLICERYITAFTLSEMSGNSISIRLKTVNDSSLTMFFSCNETKRMDLSSYRFLSSRKVRNFLKRMPGKKNSCSS